MTLVAVGVVSCKCTGDLVATSTWLVDPAGRCAQRTSTSVFVEVNASGQRPRRRQTQRPGVNVEIDVKVAWTAPDLLALMTLVAVGLSLVVIEPVIVAVHINVNAPM